MSTRRSLLVVSSCLFVGLVAAGCKEKNAPVSGAADATVADAPPPGLAADAAPIAGVAADPSAAVVTIGTEVLTRGETDRRVRDLAMRRGVPSNMIEQAMAVLGPQLEKQVVEQFVDATLLGQEAARRDIVVTDEEVATVIESISKRLPEGMTLEKALEMEGIGMDDLRKDITRGERIRKMFDTATSGLAAVTDEDVTAFYTNNVEQFKVSEQVQASHILVECAADASEADQAKAKAEAESLRKKVEEGADFAEVAKESSACPSSAKGGDLGRFGRGQMDPAFEEAAFTQEPGVLGPVIKSQFGFHIVKVAERTPAGMQTLDEVREPIRQYLENRGRDEVVRKIIEELRAKADIVYHEGAPEAGESAPEAAE